MVISAITAIAANGGSAILGGIMRFLSDNAKARDNRDKNQHDLLMAQVGVSEKSIRAARKDANKPVSKTRRFVVVAIISAVLLFMFIGGMFGVDVNVPVTTNANSFFGFEWGGQTEYMQLSGMVLIPEVLLAMSTIISFLFGSNVVKR